jgi:putative transcriptional regulator
MADSLTGRLLVASPELLDPNFFRTVVFLLAHGEEGALGVVLNRPSEASVDDLLPAWGPVVSPPRLVFLGGPVGLDTVIGVARSSQPESSALRPFDALLGGLTTVDLHQDPAEIDEDIDGARLFAGSAGWGPGQLEGELGESAWFVVDAEAGDLLTDDPDELWSRVLRRQRGRLAWFANAAGDPTMN